MALRERSRSAEPPAKRTAPTPANADRVLVCILNEDALAQFVMVQYADMPPQLAADVRERVRSPLRSSGTAIDDRHWTGGTIWFL